MACAMAFGEGVMTPVYGHAFIQGSFTAQEIPHSAADPPLCTLQFCLFQNALKLEPVGSFSDRLLGIICSHSSFIFLGFDALLLFND